MIPIAVKGEYRVTHEGDNCVLLRCRPNNTETIMTTQEADKQKGVIAKCKGKVLTAGLGLGYFIEAMEDNDDVKSVTVIEKSQEIIDLVWPHIRHDKAKLIRGDIWEYKLGDFDCAYIDIWTTQNSEEVEEMKKKVAHIPKVMIWGGI